MNGYRFLYLLALALLCVVIGMGCSSDNGESADQQSSVATQQPMTDSAQLSRCINDMLERVRYGDKSGIWENEFSYLRDDQTFDYYLNTHSMVQVAKIDSMDSVDILSVEYFKPDSAIAQTRANFTGPTGKHSELTQPITFYWHDGRWIKPTVSVYSQQFEYDEIIRRADSAAKAEAEQGY